jgi:molybdopterin-binding protein
MSGASQAADSVIGSALSGSSFATPWSETTGLIYSGRNSQRGAGHELCARNQMPGKVVNVQKGQTTSHVHIDVGHGIVITSSITYEAVDELDLKAGDQAVAVIKASDVMVAKT